MAIPRKLKHLNLFNEGRVYLAEIQSVTLPKLTRKLEEYRGGGMDAAVKIDMGGEPLELEWTLGGPDRFVLTQHASPRLGGAFLRFAGSYQNDQTGDVDQIEVTVRGRHEEIELGEQKVGEGGEMKVKSALVYYRLDWNGQTLIEIDVLGMIYIVDGVDLMAAHRDAIL